MVSVEEFFWAGAGVSECNEFCEEAITALAILVCRMADPESLRLRESSRRTNYESPLSHSSVRNTNWLMLDLMMTVTATIWRSPRDR